MVDLLDPLAVMTRMFEAEKFEDLIVFCKKILDKDPGDLLALQNISTAFLRVGEYREALAHCDVILGKHPKDEHALHNKILGHPHIAKFAKPRARVALGTRTITPAWADDF